MKRLQRWFRFTIVLLAAVQSGCGAAESTPSDPVVVMPDALVWTPSSTLPAGALSVVLDGDPSRRGTFTVRLKLPANFRIPPHHHPGTERLTVLSGSVHLGYGGIYDEQRSTRLPAGSYAVNPAGLQHFSWTSEESVVQLTASGPWVLEYADRRNDARVRELVR